MAVGWDVVRGAQYAGHREAGVPVPVRRTAGGRDGTARGSVCDVRDLVRGAWCERRAWGLGFGVLGLGSWVLGLGP